MSENPPKGANPLHDALLEADSLEEAKELREVDRKQSEGEDDD